MWAIACPTLNGPTTAARIGVLETIPGRTAPRTTPRYSGLSVTKGKHQMKFGGGYNRYTKNQVIGKDSEGDYTFDSKASQVGGQLTGDSYLDFLLGLTASFSQSNANPINHYVNQTTSVYAQDNWHCQQPVEHPVWLPLRCHAARLGTQQPGFKL